MHINVHKVDMASPNDVSGLAALIDAGTIADPADDRRIDRKNRRQWRRQ